MTSPKVLYPTIRTYFHNFNFPLAKYIDEALFRVRALRRRSRRAGRSAEDVRDLLRLSEDAAQ